MNTINFLEKKKLTYIIIFIFVVFALIHLYKINKQTNEGFDTIERNSDIKSGIFVDIPSLSQVRFNGSGLNTLLNAKANVSDLDSKADVSALNSKADVSDLNDKADKIALNSKANSSVVNSLTDTVTGLTTNVTNLMNNPSVPEYTIIQYGGNVIPQGWQLCDGSPFLYKDKSSTDNNRFVEDTNGDKINTPSLYNTQLFNPASTQVFFNFTHGHAPEGGQDSSLNHAWNQSSIYAWHSWHARFGDYMRINLSSVHEIVGIILGGNGAQGDRRFTVYTFESYVSTIHDPNLLNNYLGSGYTTANTTANKTIEYCQKNNSTNISKPIFDDSLNTIIFDKGVKGNFLTFKPLTGKNNVNFMMRIALLIRPLTKSIIKQPLSTNSV